MLQVTECPDDVRLLSRMATITESGIALGGSIECDIILPSVLAESEQNEIYMHIALDTQNQAYKLETHVEGVSVNQRAQISNSSVNLSDGDVISIHGYQLLFSYDQESTSKDAEDKQFEPAEDFYDSVSNIEFDASNIFADLESELDNVGTQEETISHDGYVDYQSVNDAQPSLEQAVSSASVEKKLDKLIEVTQNPWLQQKQLLMMLDDMVDEFVKEFDPQLIEGMVGAPSRWNGKQWNAYKNYYQRKLNEGHFKRQFKALLIECMQK